VKWGLALALTAAVSSAVWAQLAAWRCGERRPGLTARALLAGAAAFGFALAAYHSLALAGWPVRWATLAGGGSASLLAAAAIGLVEEGAKLAGILLVLEGRFRPASAAAAAAGVAAGFSALEAVVVLRAEASVTALARAALGPVAHGLLAVPLAAGVIAWEIRRERRLRPLAVALAASAALHGAGDLALAARGLGPWAYAGALLAPAFALFVSTGNGKGPLGWRTLVAHRGRPLLGSPAGGRSCV
jgi:hypothetical protein